MWRSNGFCESQQSTLCIAFRFPYFLPATANKLVATFACPRSESFQMPSSQSRLAPRTLLKVSAALGGVQQFGRRPSIIRPTEPSRLSIAFLSDNPIPSSPDTKANGVNMNGEFEASDCRYLPITNSAVTLLSRRLAYLRDYPTTTPIFGRLLGTAWMTHPIALPCDDGTTTHEPPAVVMARCPNNVRR